MVDPARHIGRRRSSSWWEPIYDPGLDQKLVSHNWQFDNITGVQRSYLSASTLHSELKDGEVCKLSGLTFTECDLQGSYIHSPSILFDECRFLRCDFAFSTWKNVAFRNCEFRESSFSIALFEGCEFRNCKFFKMGFSGNKTDFVKTFITSPDRLIKAGYSAPNPHRRSESEHVAYQKFRLEATKAHVARSILYSHQVVGDDKTYYRTARLHDLQQAKSRFSESCYEMRFGDHLAGRLYNLGGGIYWIAEMLFLYIYGKINGWGARLLQPLLVLVSFTVVMALIYSHASAWKIMEPWQKSFDIATLAGYTNQVNDTQDVVLRVFESSQLVVSIFLYTIMLSTAVSRFSRSR